MTQEINLYQAQFKKARTAFPATMMAGALLALVALAAAWAGWEFWRLERLEETLHASTQALAQREGKRQDLQATVKARAPSHALVARLKKLETVAAFEMPLAEILAHHAFPEGSGYSDFFLAFARQDLRGTWLTRIRIEGAGREILLKGYATRAELVPRYLQRLSNEAVLHGTAFEALQMAQPDNEDGHRPAAKIAFAVSTTLDEADWLDE